MSSPLVACNRKGCHKFAAGVLTMKIPAVGDSERKHRPLALSVPLFLCLEHAEQAKAQDFQTPEWCEQVRQVLHKRGATVRPDFAEAWLDVEPFPEVEHGNA